MKLFVNFMTDIPRSQNALCLGQDKAPVCTKRSHDDVPDDLANARGNGLTVFRDRNSELSADTAAVYIS